MKITKLILIIFVWQIIFVIVSAVAFSILPLQKTYVGAGSNIFITNPLLYSRGNFDGNHYTTIAKRGYGYAQQAFFPMYPKFIYELNKYTGDYYLAGVIVSLVSFTLAMVFLVKLLEIDYGPDKVLWIVLALLFFPTSFYFGAVYTESLFFLFAVSSFFFARKGNLILACILAALAANTRFVGVFLLPGLIMEWHKMGRPKKSLWALALVPLGLLSYMYFLQKSVGDPLAFIHVQPLFGSYRSDKVVMLYQVFWRYAKMVFTVDRSNLIYPVVLLEVATGILFLVLSIFSFVRLRFSYALYVVAVYLLPTLTGSFVSLPRYVLICFPGFIIIGLALKRYRWLRIAYLVVCGIAWLYWVSMYVTGFWVA